MILLFGERANKNTATKKNTNVNTHPVENSGILAMNFNNGTSLLTVSEYDTYVFSNPYAVDYAMYSDYGYDTADCGFMSGFSSAVAALGDSGFGGDSCASVSSGSFSSGASCSSFSSVG